MRVWLEDREITGLCIRVTVDKSVDGAGAEGEIVLMCAPMDSRLPRLDPACGQQVTVRQGQEELFFGRVERVSYDAAALSLTLLCFDPVSLLAKNLCRGPYRGTPEALTRQMCAECGLQPGNIWAGDGKPVQLESAYTRTGYRAIRSLYDNRCVLEYRQGKVHLYPKGDSRSLLDSGRLVGLISRNTAEEAVNQVQVYGGGKLRAECSDQSAIAQLGLRRRVETVNMTYPTPEEQARAGLKGVSRQARLTFTGRSPVKCGQIVTPDKPLMGVYGDYLVTQVVWRCEKGLITSELGVESL